MRATVIAFMCGLTCAAAPMYAAQPKWTKEPTAVLGITLGAPLPDSLPACPSWTAIDEGADLPSTLCIRDATPGYPFRDLDGLPFKGLAVSAYLTTFHGRVESITLTLDHDLSYRDFKGMLLERYGKPKSDNVNQVQTVGGAKFDSRLMEWDGAHMSITFFERATRVDKSVALFEDTALAAQDRAEKAAKEKQAASVL